MDSSMTATLAPLVLDFLEWLAVKPRAYAEVMETWRTSCPRFPIWEDVLDAGFVARRCETSGTMLVHLTPSGESFLERSGRLKRRA
jgi:hypothetical protein